MSPAKMALLLFGILGCMMNDAALAKEAPKKIKAKVYLEYDKLPAGKECGVVMEIQVKRGWHINANPSSPKMVPTTFTIQAKNGTTLTKIKYPDAHELDVAGAGTVLAYEDKIQIRGTLEIPPEAAGKSEELILQVRYQACNDVSCEPPKTFKIKGKIAVASEDSEIKKTNTDYFKKAK